MSKVVEISPTTRHEGHSKLVLKVNDEGIIERGDWLSITPVRGVEKLAIGKTYEQVPKIALSFSSPFAIPSKNFERITPEFPRAERSIPFATTAAVV